MKIKKQIHDTRQHIADVSKLYQRLDIAKIALARMQASDFNETKAESMTRLGLHARWGA